MSEFTKTVEGVQVIDFEKTKGRKIHEWLTKELWNQGSDFLTCGGVKTNILWWPYQNICKVCLGGAFVFKYEKRLEASEEVIKFAQLIKTEKNCDDLVGWNDAPERTFEEVLALCKEYDI